MFAKLFITLGALTFGLGVPFLEINPSHVFNQDWTPHARIHEVWQLMTNSALAVMCLWLVWARGQIILPAIVGLTITAGFLVAFVIRGSYGGSMKYLDGSEKQVLGINMGVLGFSIVTLLFIAAIVMNVRQTRLEN